MPADRVRRALLLALGALGTTACDPVQLLAVNLTAKLGSYTRRTDIPYGGDERQRLDVYVPRAARASRCPVVVFWHGGRWSEGNRRQYGCVCDALASLGCVAVLPDYRLYPQVRLAGFMQDAALAAAWAASFAGAGQDPERLFLMGHSAGAHLAVLVTLDPRYYEQAGVPVPRVRGIVGLSGPYDFLPLMEDDLKDMFGPPERYPLSQPINFVRADAPPMLLIQGEADRSVAPANARNLAAALARCGAKVTLRMYPRLNHEDTVAAFSRLARHRAPILEEVGAFIENPGLSS